MIYIIVLTWYGHKLGPVYYGRQEDVWRTESTAGVSAVSLNVT